MAQTVSTDIAAELNITARRNDTFTFKLQVTDPAESAPNNSKQLAIAQTDDAANNQYQAKMSVVDAATGDIKLELYSARWTSTATEASLEGTDAPPTATTPGKYYGTESTDTLKVGGAIDFTAMGSDHAAANRVVISCPYDYMTFAPGDYKYDLQIRYAATDAETVPEYTTWLYGTFTLTADITQL